MEDAEERCGEREREKWRKLFFSRISTISISAYCSIQMQLHHLMLHDECSRRNNGIVCELIILSIARIVIEQSVCVLHTGLQSRKTQQKSRKYINKNHFHCIFDGEISIIFHFRFIFILIVATCIDCCMTFIVSVILTYTTINSARMA